MLLDVHALVVANQRLSAEYNVITLAAPGIAGRAQPGQFVMVQPGCGGQPLLRRPFSIFEIVRDAAGEVTGLSLLNKQVGTGTRLLFDLQPGDHLPCLGPLGRPFTPVDPPAQAWMVAGGVGLAPFATLAERLHARRVPAVLFYGARRATDLFYLDTFERLDVRLVVSTEDGSRGTRGLITAPLEDALRREPGGAMMMYACGPTRMLRATAALAARYDRPAEVSLEQVMGCGLGGCYSCVVPVHIDGGTRFVRSCLDGPVFPSHMVAWEQMDEG